MAFVFVRSKHFHFERSMDNYLIKMVSNLMGNPTLSFSEVASLTKHSISALCVLKISFSL